MKPELIVDARLVSALAPFATRARLVAFGRLAAMNLVAAGLAAEVSWLAGVRSPAAFGLFFAAALAASAFASLKHRPSVLDTARRIDRGARLDDLIVSAVGCNGEGLPALVRERAIDALRKLAPASLFPFEAPRSWRRAAVIIVAVQMVAVGLFWGAPAERANRPNVSSLVLPAGAGAASGRAGGEPTRSVSPQRAAAAQPETARAASGTIAAPSAPIGVGAATAVAATAGSSGLLTLAAGNADDDIRAGRVPIARRGIVERYFAAIQNQRKASR